MFISRDSLDAAQLKCAIHNWFPAECVCNISDGKMTSMIPRDPQQDRPSSEITGSPESRDAYAPREVGDMDESQRDKPSSEVANGADSGDADAPSEVDPADDSQDDDALPPKCTIDLPP